MKHAEIMKNEMKKREQIVTNFEDHISSIQKQILEDTASQRVTEQIDTTNEDGTVSITHLEFENNVVAETHKLRLKYDDLLKEIAEKSAMMDQQLVEKKETTESMDAKIIEQITAQQSGLAEQIKIYTEQTLIKEKEE